MAGKVLLGSLFLRARITICLRGKRVYGEYKRDDHQYAGQQNQAQSAVSTRSVAGGARFVISECSCHVVLSRGVPRWGQRLPRVPLPQWMETQLAIKGMLEGHRSLSWWNNRG